MKNSSNKVLYLAQAAMIAAIYVVDHGSLCHVSDVFVFHFLYLL